uniref:Uncoordinated protein 58 n=1 Tax=Ascaris suum TaxID=6253 RepID=F1LDR6_ASCSU
MMTNFTADSWRILNDAQTGVRAINRAEWSTVFREYMVSVSEVVDDRRPIRKELQRPDDLDNMHNKWTFPTALLYARSLFLPLVVTEKYLWIRTLEKSSRSRLLSSASRSCSSLSP